MRPPLHQIQINSFSRFRQRLKSTPVVGLITYYIWISLRQLNRKIIQSVFSWPRYSHPAQQITMLLEKIEPYQPLFNFSPAHDYQPQRSCTDRAETMAQHLSCSENGLRILDIGCSLGYFSYYFAEKGFCVHGIDFDAKNITLCKLLQNFNPRKVKFSTAIFSLSYLKKIHSYQFDIALVLSVFHHIIHAHGMVYAQELVKALLEKIPVLLVELALKSENTTAPWKESLPEDELELFAQCPHITIEKIGTFPNHLSAVPRPLYKIKKNTARFGSQEYPIHSQKHFAHHNSHYAGRCYYDCGDFFIKKYYLPLQLKNITQLLQEVEAYQKLPANEYFPSLLGYERQEKLLQIMLTKLPGKNLYNLLLRKESLPTLAIFSQIVQANRYLFNHNLYHNDVRVWNILVDGPKIYCLDLELTHHKENENTNWALQWVILHLHGLHYFSIPYPVTVSPEKLISLSAPFDQIFEALKSTSTFQNFLKWWEENRRTLLVE